MKELWKKIVDVSWMQLVGWKVQAVRLVSAQNKGISCDQTTARDRSGWNLGERAIMRKHCGSYRVKRQSDGNRSNLG